MKSRIGRSKSALQVVAVNPLKKFPRPSDTRGASSRCAPAPGHQEGDLAIPVAALLRFARANPDMVMNIHFLELFYYVAKHGGISEAVRNMPYGIQQPAMSGQIIQLEESLGVTLFQRRPFALTPHGEELYKFIAPFFDNLTAMADKIRGGISQHVRIGASEIVLRDHLPAVLQAMRKQFPKLKVRSESNV